MIGIEQNSMIAEKKLMVTFMLNIISRTPYISALLEVSSQFE